jgi:hypothetical protein
LRSTGRDYSPAREVTSSSTSGEARDFSLSFALGFDSGFDAGLSGYGFTISIVL